MNFPYCGYQDSKVIDSRDVNQGIRRRRKCRRGGSRFTHYERLQPASVCVIKKDQRREEFDRNKLLTGISKACEKRPLPAGTIDKLVDDIEADLYHMGRAEVPSTVIGDVVMGRLKSLDHIAYIRFASVYREFADITTLKQEIDTLVGSQAETPHPASQLPLHPDEKLGVLAKKHRRNRR